VIWLCTVSRITSIFENELTLRPYGQSSRKIPTKSVTKWCCCIKTHSCTACYSFIGCSIFSYFPSHPIASSIAEPLHPNPACRGKMWRSMSKNGSHPSKMHFLSFSWQNTIALSLFSSLRRLERRIQRYVCR